MCVFIQISVPRAERPHSPSALAVTRTHHCWRSPRKSPATHRQEVAKEPREPRIRRRMEVAEDGKEEEEKDERKKNRSRAAAGAARVPSPSSMPPCRGASSPPPPPPSLRDASSSLFFFFFFFLEGRESVGCRSRLHRFPPFSWNYTLGKQVLPAFPPVSFAGLCEKVFISPLPCFALFLMPGGEEGWKSRTRREMRLNRCRYGGEEFFFPQKTKKKIDRIFLALFFFTYSTHGCSLMKFFLMPSLLRFIDARLQFYVFPVIQFQRCLIGSCVRRGLWRVRGVMTLLDAAPIGW